MELVKKTPLMKAFFIPQLRQLGFFAAHTSERKISNENSTKYPIWHNSFIQATGYCFRKPKGYQSSGLC